MNSSALSQVAPHETDFEVAIVGGGPAGLSAAVTLARARRKVVLFDHGKPRNFAAHGVHCYLGLEGESPAEIRARGKTAAKGYGVTLIDEEVIRAKCETEKGSAQTSFYLGTNSRSVRVRIVLLATGVMDVLPTIPRLPEFYGSSVHHCPFCDGWEHRDARLVALGDGETSVKLAIGLRAWSEQVVACSNGATITEKDKQLLARYHIAANEKPVSSLIGENGKLEQLVFDDTSRLECDAIFFSSEQRHCSQIFEQLNCKCSENGLVVTENSQCTSTPGVFMAGDADGETQFAIVAAAEGAIAAVAIHKTLCTQDELCV